jgi:hypothetical protein
VEVLCPDEPDLSPLVPLCNAMIFPSLTLYPSGLQISHFKIPRYIVFVEGYPLTISGKVCKVEEPWGGAGQLRGY